ncbi:hypothetical protein KFU94_66330 [Chloroflexi bacterium TSY]|nr:hypothetical protein [Chloroflexi bacterium TSY]
MTDKNIEFKSNPLTFAQKYTLYPVLEENTETFITKNTTGPLASTYKFGGKTYNDEIYEFNNILYCQIEQVQPTTQEVIGESGPEGYEKDLNLHVIRISQDPKGGRAFPIYYLPWKPRAITRIRLMSKDIPAYFVTAALQGCSVFVEGRGTPIVYHINDGTRQDDIEGPESKAIIQQMIERHRAARDKYPKRRHVRAAHMTDYMPGTVILERHEALWNRYKNSPHLWSSHHKWVPWAHTKIWSTEVSLVAQYGTIFGWRDKNQWRFCRQTRTRVVYKYYELPEGQTIEQPAWVDPTCVEFWP